MKVQRKRKGQAALFCFLAMAALFSLCSANCAAAAKAALASCVGTLLPSLFPMMAAAHFFVASGSAAWVGAHGGGIAKLLGTSRMGSALFLCGIVSGFPGGAAALARAYEAKQIGKEEAQRLCGLCNLPSPGFYLGFLGAVLCRSTALGALLFAAHLLSAILLLPIFCGAANEGEPFLASPCPPISRALCQSIVKAGQGCLCVCSFVVFFSVLCSAAAQLFPGTSKLPYACFCAFLELGSGAALLHACGAALPVLSAACAFSGICVFMQVQNTLPDGFSMRPYFCQKLFQTVLTPAFVLLFLPKTPFSLRLPGGFLLLFLLGLRIRKKKKPFPQKRKRLQSCKKSG